jgi:hypothetical protein
MKWMEIIEVRSSHNSQELLNSESSEQTIRIYSKLYLDTDYIILLLNDFPQNDQRGSQFGLHLSAALREFGMINHSVWTDIHSKLKK